VDADLDTLATALYVTIDDLLQQAPHLAPWRPRVGIPPKLSDAELLTLAVMQALLGFTSEARWLRSAGRHLRHLFPYLPGQSGYNKRLRRTAELLGHVIGAIATDTALWSDDVWVVDSTPVECGRSRHTVKRSALAGWAQYGYCASHSRYFWGLRLHLVCTLPWPAGRGRPDRGQGRRAPGPARPIGGGAGAGGGPAGAGTDRRQELLRPPVPADARRAGSGVVAAGPQGRTPAGWGAAVQAAAAADRVGQRHLQGPVGLERHGGRTGVGVAVRVLQRILALIAAIWHNDKSGQPTMRSLVAYDH
jgi:hypothetical protein